MANEGSISPRTIAAPGMQLAVPSSDSPLQGTASAISDFADYLGRARDQTQLVQARLGYSQKVDDLTQAYLHDPDPTTAPARFAKDAQDAAAPFYDTLTSEEARNAFALDSGSMSEARRISIMDTSYRRQSDMAVSSLDALADKSAKDAAYAGNAAERQAAIDNYSQSVQGVADSGMMNHADAIKRVENFKNRLSLYDGRSLIETNAPQAVKQLADPAYLPDLDPISRVELQSQADAKVREDAREARMALAQARANAEMSLSDLTTTIGSGLPVSSDLVDQAKADVRASGDPRLASRLDSSLRAAYSADSLRGASPREVEATVETLANNANAHGADEATAAQYVGARKFLDNMNHQLAQDPLAYAAQQGVAAVQPLSLNGTDNAAAWQGRIRAADMTAQHYGIAPRYLTAPEEATVKGALAPNADPVTKLTILKTLVGGFGSRAIPELDRLGVSPAIVTAGGLLSAGPAHAKTAFDIVNGETALTNSAKGGDGQSYLKPSDSARAALNVTGGGRLFGGVTLPQGMPQILQATSMLPGEAARIEAAADAIYAARAPGQGLTGKDASTGAGSALYQQALQEAAGARFEGGAQMGGLTQYRGRPLIAPATIAADGFEGVVNHLTADDLAAASVSGKPPVDATGKPVAPDLVRHTWLVTAGDGIYSLSTTDPAGGQVKLVQDSNGRPYKLNFPTALTILQARASKGAK